MADIVFFNIPAYGHTNPTLGVVEELVRRGHRVRYYSFERFQQRIEAAGARFIPCDGYDLGMELTEEDEARVGKDMVFSTQLIVNATLAMDEAITRDLTERRSDVIVGDSVAHWGKLAAMKLGIPFVSSTTTFAFNKESAAVMKPSGKELLKMVAALPKTKRILKPLRDLGYPADNILDIVANDKDITTIVYTSRMFQPQAESFSDRYHFVGCISIPPQAPFPKTGSPLVYISLGTVDNRHPGFYQRCIEAFRAFGGQVVIATGRQAAEAAEKETPGRRDVDMGATRSTAKADADGQHDADAHPVGSEAGIGYENVPPHIQLLPFADQPAVLEQADVFLSHCGMNSASEAMYYGVPLVCFPQTTEQGGVANRVEELGAGVRLTASAGTGPSSEDIRQVVEKVLADPSYREHAEEIGRSLRACAGAAGAADVIEAAAKAELR